MESNLLQNAYSLATNHNQNELSRYQSDQGYKPKYKTFEDFLATPKTKESKPRTLAQNRALWKMFENLANELNDSGNDMKRTLKPEIDIPWNKNTVCEYLWKPVQKAQLQKESTKELSTTEIDEVFLTLNRYLGTKLGITLEFPSINIIMDREPLKDQEELAADYS